MLVVVIVGSVVSVRIIFIVLFSFVCFILYFDGMCI